MSGLRAPVALVLAGPSGGGKTTVCRRLRERRGDIEFSVSATTRSRRQGEREGVDYRFMSRPAFEALVESDGLLEWAEVHGELYGTPHGNLEAARDAGRSLLLDIDVQGARQVRERAPEAVLVFLLPPSGPELLRRLHGRGSESSEELHRRMRTAQTELAAVEEFDYVVENDELEQTVAAIEAILEAESRRTTRSRERVAERAESLREALAAGTAGAEP